MTTGRAEPETATPELGLSPEEPLLEGRPPAGPSLSPSRAADFMTCPLLYRFRVIDRIPEAPSAAATRGTVVHSVLERLFDLPAADRTLARAQEMLGPQWEALLAAEPELAVLVEAEGAALPEFLAGAGGLLEQYFALEDPTRLEPRERELHVEVELESGLLLRGFVDRLDVSPAGDMRVVDYKTGRAPSPGFEAKAMFQMRFYALVLWKQYQRVPRLLQLLYLGSGEVLRYEPDEADLRATEVKVQALWRAIERATQTGDWRPSPSRLCDWCDHRDIRCPAWGGTPPPLPTLSIVPAPETASGPDQGAGQGHP
ncbi:MAG: RecB family exonuclease [Actinomycetes bacterium]